MLTFRRSFVASVQDEYPDEERRECCEAEDTHHNDDGLLCCGPLRPTCVGAAGAVCRAIHVQRRVEARSGGR